MDHTFSPEAIGALANLRTYARRYPTMGLSEAINALDNAGVFAALDEQTDYASATEILAEGAAIDMVSRSNPNVPADRALQVLHNTWHPERAELDPAEWGDTTRADMARRQGLIDNPADGRAAAVRRASCTCGRSADSPALHAGTCPVWAQHHNLA